MQNDTLAYDIALQSIEGRSFVLEIDKLMHGKGYTPLASTMNFVLVRGDEAMVQLPSYGVKNGIGPVGNGLCGYTLNGSIKKYKSTEEKNGNCKVSMQVNGVNI